MRWRGLAERLGYGDLIAVYSQRSASVVGNGIRKRVIVIKYFDL
jgi:hypothetical protein